MVFSKQVECQVDLIANHPDLLLLADLQARQKLPEASTRVSLFRTSRAGFSGGGPGGIESIGRSRPNQRTRRRLSAEIGARGGL